MTSPVPGPQSPPRIPNPVGSHDRAPRSGDPRIASTPARVLLIVALGIGFLLPGVTTSNLPAIFGISAAPAPWLGAVLIGVLGVVAIVCLRGVGARRRIGGIAILVVAVVLGAAVTALAVPVFEARLWLLYLWAKLPVAAALLAATGLVMAWTLARGRRARVVLIAGSMMLLLTAVVTLVESGIWQMALMLLAPLLAVLGPVCWTAATLGVLWLARGMARRAPELERHR